MAEQQNQGSQVIVACHNRLPERNLRRQIHAFSRPTLQGLKGDAPRRGLMIPDHSAAFSKSVFPGVHRWLKTHPGPVAVAESLASSRRSAFANPNKLEAIE